ncbi:MAG: EF-hand domain-containing protein [Xanthomonadaceae bacterium]|jgi:hypothetical protein|nr:EF-hand domain-containing protein [Xanthomonadaceae bacterium]
MVLLRSKEKGFSTRRKALLGAVVLLLLAAGYAGHVGMAITSGVSTQDMDWNGDGQVSGNEIAQAFYAVTVEKREDGQRHCKIFRWYRTGEVIRQDCRTEFNTSDTSP